MCSHRNIALLPQHLVLARIPFHSLKQEAGDYVITNPGGFHFVVNGEPNTAEATNFVLGKGMQHMKQYCACSCAQTHNVDCIAAKFK